MLTKLKTIPILINKITLKNCFVALNKKNSLTTIYIKFPLENSKYLNDMARIYINNPLYLGDLLSFLIYLEKNSYEFGIKHIL